jgi:hypothetical protein
MEQFVSSTLINQLQQQTEGFLQKAVSEWQNTPSAKLLQQPSANRWSAVQCLEHLNSYGRYYLPAIENAIRNARQKNYQADEQFTPGWVGNYFTNLMRPGIDGKKMTKMSAPKTHVPPVDLNSDCVVAEFIDQQERMITLLEAARKFSLQRAKVPVSIAKFVKLSLGDTFRFLIMHSYRHILQAEKALAAAETKEESSNKNVFVDRQNRMAH